jgi:hypothetical protein
MQDFWTNGYIQNEQMQNNRQINCISVGSCTMNFDNVLKMNLHYNLHFINFSKNVIEILLTIPITLCNIKVKK